MVRRVNPEIEKALARPALDLGELAAASAASVQAEANATCASLGLTTIEQKRAWFKAHAKRVYQPVSYADSSVQRETARQVADGEVTVEREPGQDDEEREAL